jgi:hypothetical protein
VRAGGTVLPMGGVADSDEVARMFYQNMLKATSRADEWNTTLPC